MKNVMVHIPTSESKENLLLQGVYCIKNKVTGRLYVGSTTTTFRRRRADHSSYLRRKVAKNKRLELDYHSLGNDSFEFIILEIVADLTIIREREQHFINVNKGNLYNISESATKATLGRKKTWKEIDFFSKDWILVSPNGEIKEVRNLREFAAKNDLCPQNLNTIANRKTPQISYKGWLCYHKENFSIDVMNKDRHRFLPKWRITHPSGEVFETKNLRELCRKYGLKRHFFRGNKLKGWKKERINV